MFPRFMVVCWVFFAIPAAVFLISSGLLRYHNEEIRNLRVDVLTEAGSSPFEIQSDLRNAVVEMLQYAERRAVSEGGEWEEYRPSEIRSAAIAELTKRNIEMERTFKINFPSDLTEIDFRTKYDKYKSDSEVASQHYVAAISLREWHLMSKYLAVVALIWNVIWHTGHWIWMGRKTG